MLIDLDDFKRINDEQGHHAGDRVLRTVAGVLHEEARESDVVVRHGGDEFLILMPGETFTGASALIGRIQRRLGSQVLISAGVAEYRPEMQLPEQLLAQADQVLYQVKRQLRGSSGE